MNYYDARQTKDKTGWHFTCRNDGVIWPVGYCRDHEPHATEAEARECYRQWMIDNAREWSGDEDTRRRCEFEACDTFTGGGLEVDHHPYVLCGAHRDRKALEWLVQAPGQIVASW